MTPEEAQEFLSRAFVAAVLLILMVLIAQFNSVTKPLIIITSVSWLPDISREVPSGRCGACKGELTRL